ncbi:MAG TPA: LUD domain-containing protein [Puia sp.]|uniref:LutC/YkgG family protein n=1 Tax=Puia sp. TaxID=2045100 RepID=UPI002B73E5CA|nr:LUD domain-containing protein [Puia sp.]HVU98211.1 LUD domain-containing protein [Puia sp.]
MSSRETILATVKSNQPGPRDLPSDYSGPAAEATDLTPQFIGVLEAIGGAAFVVSGYDRIATILREQFPDARRVVTSCPQLTGFAAGTSAAAAIAAAAPADPHTFDTVDLAILPAHFGVAENGACWITESQMIQRVLPFITQNLALVISRDSIVATMHQAYDRIAALTEEGFGSFIAGPSKTADIEQSLVLGAHGPRSLTVFLVDEHLSDAGFF